MNVKKSNIYTLLKQPVEFIIPRYQRPYSWESEQHVKEFLEDIKDILHNENKHFFGSIVYFVDTNKKLSRPWNKDFARYHVVDGQQRITTVILMLAAICHLLEDGHIGSSRNPEWIRDTFLENSKLQKLKLRTVATDDKYFRDIMKAKDLHGRQSESYLSEAYWYFRNSLAAEAENQGFDVYINALKRLEVVDMQLDSKDEPQKIFEKINATGKTLSEGDKIRNYALMLKDSGDSNYVYDRYWAKLERRLTKGKQVDIENFFRNYLISVLNRTVSKKKVYAEFKKYFRSKNQFNEKTPKETIRKKLNAFYSEVAECLERYSFLKYEYMEKTQYSAFGDPVLRLNHLRIEILWPFFMNVLKRYDEKKISDNEVNDIFSATENHLIRKIVSEAGIRGLEDLYYSMYNKINQRLSRTSNKRAYVGAYVYVLHNDDPPSTEKQMETGIRDNDMYSNSTIRRYLEFILTSVEDKDRGTSDLLREFAKKDRGEKKSKYSIEHIMPKKLDAEWEGSLGRKCQDIQKKWLNTLANLTLTDSNVLMSNSGFSEKKDYLSKARLPKLNERILDCQDWTEDELERRVLWWLEKIKELWPSNAY